VDKELLQLRFKTNTLLKNLVGKDLINEDNIAIVELVKNAYDAQASSVLVRFNSANNNGSGHISRLVIADNGTGMSVEDIKDKWLNIAYSDKKLSRQPSGAYYAGNKGVGRFSCDRLGEHLDLLTWTKKGKLLHLPINWPDFEVEGQKDRLIQDIPLSVFQIGEEKAKSLSGLSKLPAKGTVLVITRLRSAWGKDRLLELKRSLEKFINPNQIFQADAFKIKLSVPSLEREDNGMDYHSSVNGEVRNQVFEKLKFKATYIESKIIENGSVIATELVHEGESVFKLHERNSAYQDLGEVRTIIYYLNPYKKAYFTRQTGVRAVDFGSIFLFLNGFRVAPYGDRGDDWLGLDVRKAQGTARYLSSRELVGRIEIQDPEERFQPISSREGLKNTPQFMLLREGYFMDVLKRLERFVVDGLDWDTVPMALREELKGREGLNWEETNESYAESWDKKRQRIALSILSLIGVSPERTIRFWFNPMLLESIARERSDEVHALIAQIEGIDPTKVDSNLVSGLARVRSLIAEKDAEALRARADAAALRTEVAVTRQEVAKLEGEKETYRAQTLFLQAVAPTEVRDLLAFHHQINHDSTIVGKYIAKAIREIRQSGDGRPSGALAPLEKAFLANQRIGAVARFATKANFRAGMKKELTDLAAFFDQYIRNVAKDFTASGMDVLIQNSVNEAFEVKASRIELSILIDNIISNAVKALARRLEVSISLESKNSLQVVFRDNGKGLSSELPSVESMFQPGITTTTGSGLGLVHARRVAEEIGGKLIAVPLSPRGMELRLEVGR